MSHKKKIVIICGLVLAGILVIGIILYFIENKQYYDEKYNISGDIQKAIVSSTRATTMETPICVSDPSDIQVLLDCIALVKLNNKYRDLDIETGPVSVTVELYFNDGEVVSYDYTVYPSNKYDHPFGSFYALPSVKQQRNESN